MKRLMVALALMGSALVMAGGVALAAGIDCPNRAGGRCVGTDRSDGIEGTKRADRISGLAGDDTVRALGGADVVNGNVGDDTLYGQEGGDTLKGDTGRDTLVGRGGDDSATVSPGDLVQARSGGPVPVLATTVGVTWSC